MRSNDIVNSEQPVAEKAFDAFRSVHPHTVERAAEFLEWRKKFLGFDIYFSQPNEIELEGEGTTGNGEHLAITSTRKTSEPDPKRPRPKNAEPPEVIDLTSEPSEADDSTVFEVDVARKSTGKKKGRRDIHEIRPESPSVQRMRDNRRQQEAQILARAKRQKHPTYKVIINLGHSDDEAPIYIDDFLARHLKPHQIDGVQFLWRTAIMIKQETLHGDQSNHTGSILAHSMGLGKTLQAIVFVYTLMREVRAGNPCLPEHLKNGSGVLLVVPAIVVENWANEFDKWISKALQRKILGGIHVFPPSDKSVREVAQPFLEEWSSNRGVFIMSYTTYRILSTRPAFLADAEESNPEVESFRRRRKLLADPGPAVVICDEGHMIKNPKSAISATLSQVKTPTRICLTGYPLQNNLDEYFCMIDFVAPGFLGSLDEFRNQYHNPIANGFYVDSTPGDKQLSKERLYVLVNIIQPIVQRKDDSALRKELPLKNEYIITVKLTKEQYDVYMKYRKFCGDWYTEETILAQTSGLIMICSHPQAFKLHLEKTLRTSKKKEAKSLSLEPGAPIAEAVNDESGPTPQTLDSEASLRDSNGGNSAGTTQLESMGKDDAFKSLVRLLFDQDKDIAHRNWGRIELSFKMMMAVEIVRMSTALGDKVLVFSRYLSTLQYLRDLLTPQFEVQLLTGAAGQNRQKLIDDFNSPGMQFKVFLISTNCGGVGVNLVTANRVILIDHGWNPSLDQQAIARAYRYGQEKPTYVYRLLTYSTFEDKLHKTNIHKINLATEVVDKKNTAKLLNRDQQKKYLEPPVNPENVVSELDPNASFTDGVMTELVNKFKSGIVSINSHEEFVGEVEDDMTEHQKNRAKIALESEVNRRKSKQPISKGILSGPALSAATVLAEAEAAGNLAVGQGSAGSDGSTVPMASDLSKSVDVDDGIVDDSTEEDFPGDQDDFTKELYLMGAGLWIDEGS
ncbi:SNF2 family N-terminal domain-containing protein [Zopfochytrium polystomum]|nr:SNF2 family N-terminal domain-containing protein [Zopfochytrium polystomum]